MNQALLHEIVRTDLASFVRKCATTLSPGVPIVGLPTCQRLPGEGLFAQSKPIMEQTPFGPGLDTDDVQKLGIPVPENYSAPSYAALQETATVEMARKVIADMEQARRSAPPLGRP